MSKPPFDLGDVFRQAQELGDKIRRLQETLRHRTVEVTVGGGMVKVQANGRGEVTEVEIDPRAVDPRDVEMLQDLVRAGVNEALRRAQELAREEMARSTGLPLGDLGGLLGGLG